MLLFHPGPFPDEESEEEVVNPNVEILIAQIATTYHATIPFWSIVWSIALDEHEEKKTRVLENRHPCQRVCVA